MANNAVKDLNKSSSSDNTDAKLPGSEKAEAADKAGFVDWADASGNTALHHAVRAGRIDLIKVVAFR